MTRSHGEELMPYDPEIERTFHRRKNNIERGENSGETNPEEQLVIFEPTMEAIGAAERPMMEFNGVSSDAVRLRIFPFSLCDTAKDWLQSLPAGSITTWAALTQKFLAKYFPPAKTAKMLNEITSFVQLDRESLYEAWERCRWHHYEKLPSEAFNIIDEIATNLYSYGQERVERRTAGIHSIDAISALSTQMTALTHRMDNLGAAILNGAPVDLVVHAVKWDTQAKTAR
ncbi:UNVERIFIED_CONTAM: hypothetical protein Sradi_5679100 [Sesamum radiatum]|uniref:Retrotransposon gag domain-containing protein n=1 Tax=Sesamum radiatum TaxID=300843 RepID=A0AAW2L1T0_SESRA